MGDAARRLFITGCGSGFGRALARACLRRGDVVVGTEVDLTGVRDGLLAGLPAEADGRLTLVEMELRDPTSIARATAGGGPVDVLVNNAGYAVFGTQAETDVAVIEALFQANVLGTARVTQALLPTLRARRGAVVQLSSVAGRMVFPESGFYAATKHALEALSEALYLENCTFGLRVIVVEPGSYATGFLDRAQVESPPRRSDGPYGGLHGAWDASKSAVLCPGQSAEEVAAAILASLDDERPFHRVPVGVDAAHILALREALTPDAWVWLQGSRLGGPEVAGLMPGPDEVLAAPSDSLFARWPHAVLAARGGHLERWATAPGGAEALARLLGCAHALPATLPKVPDR